MLTRDRPLAVRHGVGRREFAGTGRWVEADVHDAVRPAHRRVGLRAHRRGGTPRQDTKLRFLDAMGRRMSALRRAGGHVVVTGDLNVAHREADLKNWKGNRGKAGFLPDERALLDRWTSTRGGYVDVHRALAGEGPGPYTWWSWRGQAFDNDSGWRIDYQLATAELAARAVKAEAGRAATYAERWSDHAAVVVDYDARRAARTARGRAGPGQATPRRPGPVGRASSGRAVRRAVISCRDQPSEAVTAQRLVISVYGSM